VFIGKLEVVRLVNAESVYLKYCLPALVQQCEIEFHIRSESLQLSVRICMSFVIVEEGVLFI